MIVFIVSLLVLIVDQLTKNLAITHLATAPVEIIKGIFNLTLVQNRGAAFGIMQNGKWFFLFGTPIIILAIIAFIVFNKRKSSLANISLALIIGGAVGNYVDRIKYGYVIDFFDFKVWPVFNVADSCVVVGTILFAFYVYFIDNKVKN